MKRPLPLPALLAHNAMPKKIHENKLKYFLATGFAAFTSLLTSTSVDAGPQWAYNMAAYEYKLYRQGVSRSEVIRKAYKRYPEYHKYIDEYGISPVAEELFNQCSDDIPSDSKTVSTVSSNCLSLIHI